MQRKKNVETRVRILQVEENRMRTTGGYVSTKPDLKFYAENPPFLVRGQAFHK